MQVLQGLAAAACLSKAGLDFVVLEKEHQVASSWRRHYARLHLHTVKQHSALPFLPFPKSYPRCVPRDLVIRYLESYAAHFDLRPKFAETVNSVRREANTWVIESTSGSFRAPFVVIASGYNAEPVSPSLVGIQGQDLSIESTNIDAKSFFGQSVLVVGMGNTGAEIALDLAEGGASAMPWFVSLICMQNCAGWQISRQHLRLMPPLLPPSSRRILDAHCVMKIRAPAKPLEI